MRIRPSALLLLLLASNLPAQATPVREVTGGALVSNADPAASFAIDKAFQYAGGQVIDILKVAGAEQHFFIEAGADHSIRRFYWLQFEHYYPDNNYTYDYSGFVQKPVQLGAIAFMGDVRTSANYFTMDDRPGSDSKAAENFLRARGFKLDGTFVTLRLFHLPDATKRRELMIIYGELLPSGASEEAVKAGITAHAQADIGVH
jgi:hypothetical protein